MRSELEATPTPLAILQRSAATRPSHPALIFLSDPSDRSPRVITYRELADEVEAAQSAFRAAGLTEQESVAILLPGTPESIVAWIAAMATGVAFPMNLLLSSDALGAQLALARARIAVTLGEHPALDVSKRLKIAASRLPALRSIVEISVEEIRSGTHVWKNFALEQSDASRAGLTDPDRIAALFHTGGTTGEPRLAQLSARNVAAGALMTAAAVGWRADDRVLCGLPLFHVGGAIDTMLGVIAAGATLILPGLLSARDPDFVRRVWALVDETETTLLGLVPTSLAAAVNTPLASANLKTLRAIVTGGSALSPLLARRIEAHVDRPVVQIYGMTETSGIVTAQPLDGLSRSDAVGFPPPLLSLRVRDADGAEVQAGVIGEVHVQGPNVFKGYLTAAGTVGVPENHEVISGDLGMIGEDGQLRLLGRSKDVIIRGGHNIDPAMIEDAAYAHSDIRQAGAVSMPDAYAGELPVLYVALHAGAQLSPDEISTFVGSRIAEPPARPRYVCILPELPLTPFGKIARFRLRQLAVQTRVAELLKDFPVDEIVCTDPACKQVRLTWSASAGDSDRMLAAEALGQLSLEST